MGEMKKKNGDTPDRRIAQAIIAELQRQCQIFLCFGIARWRCGAICLCNYTKFMTQSNSKEEMMNLEQLDNVSGGRIGKPWVPPGSRDLINKIKDFIKRIF